MDAESLAAEVRRHFWYHTIELAPGVVTAGMFDHRPVVDRYRLPADLTGQRCLDVGTFDGFWAFEMERRGAAEVVALDLADPRRYDWPRASGGPVEGGLGADKRVRFELARRALGSHVRYEERSVYELGPDLGQFDVVFCGDLLVHLKDPVTAVEHMHDVTAPTGRAIVCNPVRRFWFASRRPMAQFDGLDQFEWWALNMAALTRLLRAAGFAPVEAGRPFSLPATSGGTWKGRRGVVVGYVS